MRKYQVRVVRKEIDGPKLFVNGPSEREIFLDKYFGYEHSILIANIGDRNLTGLIVELDAAHVKLDDYWTVGGGGNNTLEAFAKADNPGPQADNMAKITLVPDGIGEIGGTLTISAEDQTLVVIELTGYAGDPHIITETLGDAVKGERYFCQIEPSKLPDWNEVTFRLVEGKLPQGLHLDSKIGEISGTPEETGDFRIEVGASYSIDESYAEYTLKVADSSDDDEGSDSGDDSGSESGLDSGGSGSESGSGSGSRDSGSIIDNAESGYTDDSWIWDGNGWKCKAPDGSVLANGWHQLSYKGSTDWYFFYEQGYMVTGWLDYGGRYFNEASDGTRGAMAVNTWVDGRYVDGTGVRAD